MTAGPSPQNVTLEPFQHWQTICEATSVLGGGTHMGAGVYLAQKAQSPYLADLDKNLTFTTDILCLTCSDLLTIYKMIQYLATANHRIFHSK